MLPVACVYIIEVMWNIKRNKENLEQKIEVNSYNI
jgi:hypothetical protein